MSERKLEFGYNQGLPRDVEAAWGARAIWRDGQVGLLADRISTFGPPDQVLRIVAQLDQGLFTAARDAALRLFETGTLSPRDDREVSLYDGPELVIKGNPQRSYGYLYLVAYMKGGGVDA